MTRVASWSLLRFEVLGGEGSGGCVGVDSDQFQPFIPYTLSRNHTPPSPFRLPPAPLHTLSLHPPITCHPKGVIQASSLEKNGLKREAGLLSVSFPRARVCVCVFARASVCVGVKYSLCGVCEAVCQEGREGERGSRWTASLLSAVLCPHLLFLSLSFICPSFSAFPLSLFFPRVFLFSPALFHHSFLPLPPSFTLCCLVADGSVGQQQQQQQQSRSQSVSRRWGVEKGVVERGGERRWGSGIWRAWLRGPLRGSVYVRVVV